MTDAQLQADLRVLSKDHPFARAVHELLMRARENEAVGLCQPNLSNEQRHFNSGRLAAVSDMIALYDGARARPVDDAEQE